MKLTVGGNEVYLSTGGRAHIEGRPSLLFLHGSGQSHLSWTQQSRAFAYDGYNVLAPDFPGHGKSAGAPLSSISEMADWACALLDAAGVAMATLVGHSQGCLVALELAARRPERVAAAVFAAGAAAIPVNEALLHMAVNAQEQAIAAMMAWGSGPLAHKFSNTVPGASLIGTGRQIMRGNVKGTLAADLEACNAYAGGLEAASKISCPALCILAEKDRMTPLKSGLQLAGALKGCTVSIVKGGGHMLPPECPREVNAALRDFLARPAKTA